MQTRRHLLKRSAIVASLLAGTGLFPQFARAASYNKGAFEAKSVAEVLKALGAGAPIESKEVTIGGPDIAENGAVVPLTASTSMAGVKQLLILVEKNPAALVARYDVSDSVEANRLTCMPWPSWPMAAPSLPRRKSRSRWAAAAAKPRTPLTQSII
jgi:sulfur-oxidizing protein SoxY